jgi:CheY-like chemotaxis protein/tetratricopeptide (TPR) repeat protein
MEQGLHARGMYDSTRSAGRARVFRRGRRRIAGVPCILLAEGHAPTREFVERALADSGFEPIVADDAERAYELYAARRPAAVVLSAELSGGAAALAQRLHAADPRVLIVVTDQEHLGRARGLQALLPLKANAYVANPTQRELVEKLQHLVSQSAGARDAVRGVSLVLSRKPTGRGELRPGALARMLHQIWRSLSEGILVLEDAAAERRICFRRGVPVAWQSTVPEEGLVGWLASQGRLDEVQRGHAVEAMASGLSAGAALIAAGVLEPGEQLQASLGAHLKAMLVRAVAAREGRWRFHPGLEFASEVHAVEVLPLPVILDGGRAGLTSRHFTDSLKAVMDAYPARTAEFQQLLPACGLSSQDVRLALSLDGREQTRDWLGRQKDLQPALSLLWFLSLVSAVAFQDDAAPADAYGPPPVRRKKPLPFDRAEALRQVALQILPGTYFHALGVDIAADDEEVERAYHEVASRFHPDAFAEYDVADLEDLLTAVQDKVTAAHRVLANEEKRRAYLSFLVLKLELTGARRAGIVLDAEIALKRGERALLSRRNAEAVQALRAAVEANAKEPEYHAMLGFAELYDPVLPAAARRDEARRCARRALALSPDHPRATAVMALAEAEEGAVAEARRLVLGGLKAHPASDVLKRVLHRLNSPRA